MTHANEYIIETEDTTYDDLLFLANTLVHAEKQLLINTDWPFVSVWQLSEETPLTHDSPCSVFFPISNGTGRVPTATPQTVDRFYTFTDLSNKYYNRTYDSQFYYDQLANVADGYTDWSFGNGTEYFIVANVAINMSIGNPLRFQYKGAVQTSDYVHVVDGKISVDESGDLVRKRFPAFQSVFKYIRPFLFHGRIDKDGKAVRGGQAMSQPLLSSISDLKIARAEYKKHWQTQRNFRYQTVRSMVAMAGYANKVYKASMDWGHNTRKDTPGLGVTQFQLQLDLWAKHLQGAFPSLIPETITSSLYNSNGEWKKTALVNTATQDMNHINYLVDSTRSYRNWFIEVWNPAKTYITNVGANANFFWRDYGHNVNVARAQADYALIDYYAAMLLGVQKLEAYWPQLQRNMIRFLEVMAWSERTTRFKSASPPRITRKQGNVYHHFTRRERTATRVPIKRNGVGSGEFGYFYPTDRQFAPAQQFTISTAPPLANVIRWTSVIRYAPAVYDERKVWDVNRRTAEADSALSLTTGGTDVTNQRTLTQPYYRWDHTIHPLDAEQVDAETVAFLEAEEENLKIVSGKVYKLLSVGLKEYGIGLPDSSIGVPLLKQVIENVNPTDQPDPIVSVPTGPYTPIGSAEVPQFA